MPVNNLIILRKGLGSEWATTNPVLSSGEPGFDLTNSILKVGDGTNTWIDLPLTASSDLYVYAKNTTGSSLTKGQVVYINGAVGNNPTLALAVASGEPTSSKTLGLLKQNLGINEFGYVVSEGILDGVNTNSASAAGDPMWLSPSTPGAVVYGLANKPSAPNHMVFLGYVLRKQLNNGKVYVKVQNGYELEELHNVAISGVTNGQFLQYNSSSELWVPSSSGNFSTLQVNGTNVSLSGHSHSSSDITDWNEAVDDRVSNLLVGISGINISYNDSSNILNIAYTGTAGGGGVTINNYANNRVLTSDGTSTGIDAESDLVFIPSSSGDKLGIGTTDPYGNLSLTNGYFVSDNDSLKSLLTLRNSTSNNTETTLFTDGSAGVMILPAKSVWNFNISVNCYSDTNDGAAGWNFRGVVKRTNSTTALVDTVWEENFIDSSLNGVSARVVANTGTSSLDILVSGLNSNNIRWTAGADIVQIVYSFVSVTPTVTPTISATPTVTPTITSTTTNTPTVTPTLTPTVTSTITVTPTSTPTLTPTKTTTPTVTPSQSYIGGQSYFFIP